MPSYSVRTKRSFEKDGAWPVFDEKPIRLTKHAQEQCLERGTSEAEVLAAIRQGAREMAKQGREMYRLNLPFGKTWSGKTYAIKQVAPVVKEEADEIVVITVYTFYF